VAKAGIQETAPKNQPHLKLRQPDSKYVQNWTKNPNIGEQGSDFPTKSRKERETASLKASRRPDMERSPHEQPKIQCTDMNQYPFGSGI
jgi:hypothetical protein